MDKQAIIELLRNNDKAIGRALMALTARQTLDEQIGETTRYQNGMGFRPCHAVMGTSMANWFQTKGFLSAKQLAYWRTEQKDGKMRIEIYANQLLLVAKEKAAAKQATEVKQTEKSAPANPYIGCDYGNLMEERMVLDEMVDYTDDHALAADYNRRISMIDEAVKQMMANDLAVA